MKYLGLLGGIALLAGCAAQDIKYLPGDHYLVDLDNGVMCRSSDCLQLSLIIPSYYEHEIAHAYGLQKGQTYNWNTQQFANLLITPPNKLYAVEKISDSEFRLPINQATAKAFATLQYEYDLLYSNFKL